MNIIKGEEESRGEMRNIFSTGINRRVKNVFVEM